MLDALFENFFGVIVLIGVILSMFSKFAEDNKEQQQKRQPGQPQQRKMPQPPIQRQDQPTMHRRVEKMEREVQPTFFDTIQENVETAFEKQQRAHLERLQTLEEERQALEKRATDIHTSRNTMVRTNSSSKVESAKDPFPSYRSRIVEGIVMAEVLGKPRARNPYRGSPFAGK